MVTKNDRFSSPKFKKGDTVQLFVPKGLVNSAKHDTLSEGTVVRTYVRKNAAGRRRHCVTVEWHRTDKTQELDQNRLKFTEISNKKFITSESKSKPKESFSFEILNIDKVPEKEVFTVKTNGSYFGCVNFMQGFYVGREEFPTPLAAANGARKLRATLSIARTEKLDSELFNNETKKTNKNVVIRSKSRLMYKSKLCTFEETLTMPLLSFQEVWVITKEGEYVKDSLNKETKKLVTFTNERDKAQFFYDHEEAKRRMRVLKGTVGPGFGLARFWVKN